MAWACSDCVHSRGHQCLWSLSYVFGAFNRRSSQSFAESFVLFLSALHITKQRQSQQGLDLLQLQRTSVRGIIFQASLLCVSSPRPMVLQHQQECHLCFPTGGGGNCGWRHLHPYLCITACISVCQLPLAAARQWVCKTVPNCRWKVILPFVLHHGVTPLQKTQLHLFIIPFHRCFNIK